MLLVCAELIVVSCCDFNWQTVFVQRFRQTIWYSVTNGGKNIGRGNSLQSMAKWFFPGCFMLPTFSSLMMVVIEVLNIVQHPLIICQGSLIEIIKSSFRPKLELLRLKGRLLILWLYRCGFWWYHSKPHTWTFQPWPDHPATFLSHFQVERLFIIVAQ